MNDNGNRKSTGKGIFFALLVALVALELAVAAIFSLPLAAMVFVAVVGVAVTVLFLK